MDGKFRIKKKHVAIGAVVIVAALLGIAHFRGGGRTAQTGDSYVYIQPERRSITQTIEQSGTLMPLDSYTVTTLSSGEISYAGFEEGDVVEKDDVLYRIDASGSSSYEDGDKYITSPISGTITGFSLREGDGVSNGMSVAVIENTLTLELTEYYDEAQLSKIYVGMPAAVSVPEQMMEITGKVSSVSSSRRISSTGVSCVGVTVSISNPGSLVTGLSASSSLSCADGTELFPTISDEDGLGASARETVSADMSGKVAAVRVNNKEQVKAGQLIAVIEANESTKSVKAPISGTIVEKYYKQGETSESGKPLCIIYDLSCLTVTVSVDELDISKVSLGQHAVITADAVSGREYSGVVTRVGVNGTVGNGVTTYPVDIRIDETEGLLPGMNIDATIVVAESSDALAIPSGAVARPSRVLVKSADGSTAEGAPEGYSYVDVTTGLSDEDYVEVLSGITENDTIAYIPASAQYSSIFSMMNNMGGPNNGRGGRP